MRHARVGYLDDVPPAEVQAKAEIDLARARFGSGFIRLPFRARRTHQPARLAGREKNLAQKCNPLSVSLTVQRPARMSRTGT
jgi:hypothetical protein